MYRTSVSVAAPPGAVRPAKWPLTWGSMRLIFALNSQQLHFAVSMTERAPRPYYPVCVSGRGLGMRSGP